MILNREEYRSKVLGCWMGKNIGGTLGAPFEWKRQINNVDFYTQDLQGEPLPNDDLDIQLLWLVALEEQGVKIDGKLLGEYFLLYVTPHWAEYGMAKINMRSGLHPPLSGMHNNPYKHSCGAFIRSEIWACIAPGRPALAAKYGYEDAIIDHGDGEGTFAEVFCAALESAAFVENDIRKLISIGLSYIPEECGVAGAVNNAIASYDSGKSWLEARDAILADFRGGFDRLPVSKEDREKGFAEGIRGWDAPSNIGIIVLGLLYGEGDFDKTMCTTVNCGEDTDCTGATIGSLFGILHGIEAIPEKWINPIGRTLKTACLNLGELGYFGNQLPADIDNLTNRVENVARQVIRRYRLPIAIVEGRKTDLSDVNDSTLFAPRASVLQTLGKPTYQFDFFDVAVDYEGDPTISSSVPKTISLTIYNRYKVMENFNLHWYVPDGWEVWPSADTRAFVSNSFVAEPETTITFTLKVDEMIHPFNRCAVELSVIGRPTVMLVPILLMNGNT